MKEEIRQILLEKLKKMSEARFTDEMSYVDNCRVMNEIAITLLEKISKDDE